MSPQAANKTVATAAKVSAFLAKEKDAHRRADCEALVALMSDLTGEPAVMWGASIVGFGTYHYRYASGREGDFLVIGFSPRKAALTIYAMGGVWDEPGRLTALGRCTGGGSCLYVKRLGDIDQGLLRKALAESMARIRRMFPPGATTAPATRSTKPAAKKAAKKVAKTVTKNAKPKKSRAAKTLKSTRRSSRT